MAETLQKPSIVLHPDLVDNVARGSCVLFFGADHPLATPGPPTRRQLADALAERYPDQVDSGQSLADAAQQFISRQSGNRNALYSFLQGQVAPAPVWQPTDLHRAIVSLGLRRQWSRPGMMTLTERPSTLRRKRVARVVSGVDAAYTGGGEDVILVKLYGDVKQTRIAGGQRRRCCGCRATWRGGWKMCGPSCGCGPSLFIGWDPGDERPALPVLDRY